MKKVLLLAVIFISAHYFLFSQEPDSKVSKLQSYFDDYSDALRGYRLAIREMENMTSVEKYEAYQNKKEEIRQKFSAERTKEYESLDGIRLCVSHSCTKGGSGGKTKDCGWQNIIVPEGYIEREGTFKLVSGQAKQINDDTNGIYQSKSSEGRIAGTVCAEFTVDRAYIKNKIFNESKKLIGDIVASHKKAYPDEGPYW